MKYKRQDEHRGSAAARGYDKDWHRIRVLAFVRDGWRCQDPGCDVKGGWEPELVKHYCKLGLGLPSTAAMLEVLRIRQRAGERHLHGDHILTIEDRPDLRLDVRNVQTLCSICHNRRTLRESVPHESASMRTA